MDFVISMRFSAYYKTSKCSGPRCNIFTVYFALWSKITVVFLAKPNRGVSVPSVVAAPNTKCTASLESTKLSERCESHSKQASGVKMIVVLWPDLVLQVHATTLSRVVVSVR